MGNDKKGECCETSSSCKCHKFLAPLIIVFLFLLVFSLGLALGQRFGTVERGERGGEWGRGFCAGNDLLKEKLEAKATLKTPVTEPTDTVEIEEIIEAPVVN